MGEELILYIEGMQERAAVAYNRMAPDHRDRTIWAKNPEEAIEILEDYRERLVLVFLSNDLNEFIQGDIRREDSGAEIVRYLERQDPERFKCGFIIQDHDKRVGERLTHRLKAAGYRATHQPFGT
jgi:hypothetical protein